MNNQDHQSPPTNPGSGLRRIVDIAKPLAKKIIIAAYFNGYLSKARTQALLRALRGRVSV